MKLNKAEIAEKAALIILNADLRGDWDMEKIADCAAEAWKLADAMQAEADKRVVKGVLEVLNSTNSTPLDWQPDWSQAPTDKPVVHWAKMEMGQFMWIWYSRGAPIYIPAPDFGYVGHWKDSLRKRPQ